MTKGNKKSGLMLVGGCLLAALLALPALAEVKSDTVSDKIKLPTPPNGNGKLVGKPTVEVYDVAFQHRFGLSESYTRKGKFDLATGGMLANRSKEPRSVRVFVLFLDEAGGLIFSDMIQSDLNPGGGTFASPVKNVPAELLQKIAKYQVTMQVSDKRWDAQ